MFWGFWILSSWSCQFMKRRRKPTVVQLNSYEPAIVKGGGTWEKPGRKTEDMVFCNLPTTWGSKKNRCLAPRGIHPSMKDLHIFPLYQRPPPRLFWHLGRKKWLEGPTDILGRWINSGCGWFLFLHERSTSMMKSTSTTFVHQGFCLMFSPEKLL